MKRLLHEPLLHFLALGAVLFGFGLLRGDTVELSANRIAIPQARPRRGRPPNSVQRGPNPKAQRNFTDPDSRIMPASGDKGSFVQGYNCQLAVDAGAQIIVAAEVTQAPNDTQQAQPLLQQVMEQTGQVPKTAGGRKKGVGSLFQLRLIGCSGGR